MQRAQTHTHQRRMYSTSSVGNYKRAPSLVLGQPRFFLLSCKLSLFSTSSRFSRQAFAFAVEDALRRYLRGDKRGGENSVVMY